MPPHTHHYQDLETGSLSSPGPSPHPHPLHPRTHPPPTPSHRTGRILKNPLFRTTFIGIVIVMSCWLLLPYLVMFWDLVGKTGGFPPERLGDGQFPPPPVPPPLIGPPPPLTEAEKEGKVWNERREKVKNAYRHALKGYLDHAFPNDELASVSGSFSNKYNGWGVSLVDSLDTMWIMGLKAEFNHALEHVARLKFVQPKYQHASFFETTIRYLGGLLSAHALSGSPILLSRADDLGQKLLPVFNATQSGLPWNSITIGGDPPSARLGGSVVFAEIASCQLEFKYLAKLTGRSEYYEKVENVMSFIYKANVTDGLFPTDWSVQSGEPTGRHISVGAAVDSGYEYMLKQYLLTGDAKARDQYLKSANGIINHLLYVTPNRSLLYATDTYNGLAGEPTHHYEHLTCFLPGLFALGVHTLDLNETDKERHLWAAKGLAYTCYISYMDQTTGLGPDVLQMVDGRKWVEALKEWKEGSGGMELQVVNSTASGVIERRQGRESLPPGLREPEREKTNTSTAEYRAKRDYYNWSSTYLLRPETIESLFLLWKATGEKKWRERGWEIFQALEVHSKTQYGYANVIAVDSESPRKEDDMPSWFLAETLKYFYFLFDDSNPISLDHWVLNTEAHPLPRFNWTEWEKKAYNITY